MTLEESEVALDLADAPYFTMTKSDPSTKEGPRYWKHIRRNVLSSPSADPVFNWISPEIEKDVLDEKIEEFGDIAVYTSSTAFGRADESLQRYLVENPNIHLYNPPEIFNESKKGNLVPSLKDDVPVSTEIESGSTELDEMTEYLTSVYSSLISDSGIEMRDSKQIKEFLGSSEGTIKPKLDPMNTYNVTIVGDQPVHAVKWSGKKPKTGEILGDELGIYGKMPKAFVGGDASLVDFQDSSSNHSDLLAFSYDVSDAILRETNLEEPTLLIGAEIAEVSSERLRSSAQINLFEYKNDRGNFYILTGLTSNPGSAADMISAWKPGETAQSSLELLNSASDLTQSDLDGNQITDLESSLDLYFPQMELESIFAGRDTEYFERAQDLAWDN
jgi:hypothetical protein